MSPSLTTRRSGRTAFTLLGAGLAVLACADSTGPTITGVDVASPIGALLDIGGTAQLTATATATDGGTLGGVTFTWTSSNPDMVSVDAGGRIQAVALGAATIRAEAEGATGSLAVSVVDADLDGITMLVSDAFVSALVAAASDDVQTRLEEAAGACTGGAGDGYLELIQDCIAGVRAEVSEAADPTDQALLAVLALFVDEVERLLNR